MTFVKNYYTPLKNIKTNFMHFFAFLCKKVAIPWGADLLYIPFSQASPVKREPVALKVQRHAGNTYVLPEQKPFPLCYCESPLLALLFPFRKEESVRVIGTRWYANR